MTEDSKAILTELRSGSFSQAQIKLSDFSGTDASQLDENGVRITVETQALKLAQKVFIPLAWFALGGLPGILLYWTSTVIAERYGSGEIGALGLAPQLGTHSINGPDTRFHGRSRAVTGDLDSASK